MKDFAADELVIARLRAALDADGVPSAARKHAKQLIERLSNAVRVTLLGMPGSGKSSLINMFVGRAIIPTDMRLPSVELVWGDRERIVETASDGAIIKHDGCDFSNVSERAAYLRVEMPIEVLHCISLLEVVTDGSAGELSAAVDWATRRTDIAIWCSQAFDEPERIAWARVPETLKDHAFIVLTKADILSAEKKLASRVDDLEAIVAEEFHSLFAIATLQALRAYRDDGTVDEALRHASGGIALTDEILRHAERGRRADLDTADLFLSRYQIAAPDMPVVKDDPQPKDVPSASAPSAQGTPVPVVAAVQPAQAKPNLELIREGSQFLARRAEGIERKIASWAGPSDAPGLIGQCVDTVEHLVDHFSQDETGCAISDSLIDDFSEASDLLMLMQSEDGEGPAADAVTLLLQMKRQMEVSLAA